MKKICLLLAFAFTVFANEPVPPIDSFADGVFAGTGEWTDSQGKSIKYLLEVSFDNNIMTSRYQWDEEADTESLSFVFNGSGNFDVYIEGQHFGTGSCENTLPVTCQYSIQSASIGLSLTESLYFFSGRYGLLITGQKNMEDYRATWQATLDAVSNP